MPTELNKPLPRPIVIKGNQPIVTLDDAVRFLCAAAGKVKKVEPLNQAVAAVMNAAQSPEPAALEIAAEKVERLAERCSKR